LEVFPWSYWFQITAGSSGFKLAAVKEDVCPKFPAQCSKSREERQRFRKQEALYGGLVISCCLGNLSGEPLTHRCAVPPLPEGEGYNLPVRSPKGARAESSSGFVAPLLPGGATTGC
jgi:hypothetical protein